MIEALYPEPLIALFDCYPFIFILILFAMNEHTKDPFEPEQESHFDRDDLMAGSYTEASHGKRFLNYIIDLIVSFILLAFLIAAFDMFGLFMGVGTFLNNQIVIQVISLFVMVLYYTVMEISFGKSVGKFLTRTQVVTMEEGIRPSLGMIIGRSFARLIPFDAVSFLFSGGWHDTLTSTVVVNDDRLH